MRLLRLLMLAGTVGAAFHGWSDWSGTPAEAAPSTSSGFVAAAMPNGAPPDTVVIVAPFGASSDAARRADALADALADRGVAIVRSVSYSADAAGAAQQAALDRAVAVIRGEIPAVFVNGRAKANPTLAAVVAELGRGR